MKHYLYTLIALLLLISTTGLSCGKPKDGGIFRSLDYGENWEQKTFVSKQGRNVVTISDVNILALAFFPTDTNRIYLGTQDQGLYITFDGGEQWWQTDIKTGSIPSIAIDQINSNNIYLAHNNTILKSTDEGKTWNLIYTDVNNAIINVLAVDSFDNNKVYAGTSGGEVMKSQDAGAHWDLRFQGKRAITTLVVANYDTRIIYFLTAGGTVYKTVSGGEFDSSKIDSAEYINSGWFELLSADIKKNFNGLGDVKTIALDPQDNSVIYIVSKRGLMRGIDGGTNWSDIVTLVGFNVSQNETIRNLTVAPDEFHTIYFTLGDLIHKSTDQGNTWKILDRFPSVRPLSVLAIDPKTSNVIYLGTQVVKKKSSFLKIEKQK